MVNQFEGGTQDWASLSGFWERYIEKKQGLRPQYLVIMKKKEYKQILSRFSEPVFGDFG
mgnify:CR=1 FL=1